jgi:dTDP-4-amino-4,6-dideoxygalactose transaminase
MSKNKFSSWPFFSKEDVDKVQKILLSGKVNYWTGNECRKFEKEFATFTNTQYAIALANGTVALDLAIFGLGIKFGDEIIVTSRTFIASISSIINAGAIPKFVDVSSNSQNISAQNITDSITSKTKAIMCVHLAGWPCDMDEIMKIANEYNLFIIEDCAQAHGAKYKGKSVGSIGDVGCWSFCQDKIMSTGGEGGMVTTNNELLWKKMWAYKDHGKSYDAVYNQAHPPGPSFKWLHESFGTNWRLTEFQGAIGRLQLKKMSDWTTARNNNLKAIWRTASSLNGLRVPDFKCQSCNGCNRTNKCIHAGYKCYVFVEPRKLNEGWSRNKIIESINSKGIPCFPGSCSEVYLEKAFDDTNFRPKNPLPIAKTLGENALMFLIDPTISKNQIKQTCLVLASVMSQAADQD